MRQPLSLPLVAGCQVPGPCVLVVDDDDVVRAVLAQTLRVRGFTVLPAATKAEAVEAYVRKTQPIDLALLDVSIRGTSGQEVFAALRLLDPDLPCCFMSAGLLATTCDELMALGALAVFPKPFPCVSALCRQLRTFAGRPTVEPAGQNMETTQWTS